MAAVRLSRVWRWALPAMLAVALLAGLGLAGVPAMASARHGGALPHASAPTPVTLADFQAMIFVWASGTPQVQQIASGVCHDEELDATRCAQMSAAVRGAWLQMMVRDPAALGRVGARPAPRARAVVLAQLATRLRQLAGTRTAPLLTATRSAFAEITAPGWVSANVPTVIGALPQGNEIVWATSFEQTSLPDGLNPTTSPYVALPDAYLKYANWGEISNIPSIYQAFYAPAGTTANWRVSIATGGGMRITRNVLVTDVGPWNEDDNWWDPNDTSATLPANCPVSTTPPAADATTNALVDGICPNDGQNLRRLYYYLLYQHGGLPFFQATSYQPSGNFADGTAWPTAMLRDCAESVAASTNDDGIVCANNTRGYNASNGAWLRDGTRDAPILNQSSVDLSPALDQALGWTYPSSGLVQVGIRGLP